MANFYRNPGGSTYNLRGPDRPGCLLLAEGDAEAMFLEKWLTAEAFVPEDIAVVCFRGHRRLDLNFRNLAEDENFPSVNRFGFFLDAETVTAKTRAATISALLRRHGLITATDSLKPGVRLNVGVRSFALFVSPNNQDSGFIEHLVLNEISTTEFAECIENLRLCVEAKTGATAHAKTLVQAYIGAKKPGMAGTGKGFEANVLHIMHQAYAEIRSTFAAILR